MVRKFKGWGLLGAVLGVLELVGCATTTHLSSVPVHSVAYYAAQIPPPVVQPVAPVVSPAISAPVAQAVHIVISTSTHSLTVYKGDAVLATYPVAIGFNGAAPKRTRGDDVTPVGRYHIGWVSRDTRYGPFMGLTYPNRQNAEWGLREGIINKAQYRAIVAAVDTGQIPPQNTPLGGEIGIHGMGPQFADDPQSKVFPGRWTAGCVALSNWDAQQIAAMVQVGTPVEIVGNVRGFRRNIESVSAAARYKSAAALNTTATSRAVAKPQDTAMDTLVAALAPTAAH